MYKRMCPLCGKSMTKNGFTSKGSQRWRCRECSYSSTMKYRCVEKDFRRFYDYLTKKQTQSEMCGAGRQFRRDATQFWDVWPVSAYTERQYRAIYCDGTYLAENVVLLIAVADTHEVLAWAVAPTESAADWIKLLRRIETPQLAVCDGGTGFLAAAADIWKGAKIQRCQFHLIKNIKIYTKGVRKLDVTKELFDLIELWKDITTEQECRGWEYLFDEWCQKWRAMLNEKYRGKDGKEHYCYKGLRNARALMRKVIREGSLFAYIAFADELEDVRTLATNNYIEGAINGGLKEMLRIHRGMPLIHRIKACYWWLYMRSVDPLPIRRILELMPTDAVIEALMHPRKHTKLPGSPDEWGSSLVWDELRHGLPYRGYFD